MEAETRRRIAVLIYQRKYRWAEKLQAAAAIDRSPGSEPPWMWEYHLLPCSEYAAPLNTTRQTAALLHTASVS